MALTPTNVGNNPATPGIAAEVFVPDQLIAGPFQLVTDAIVVASGQGVLKRGTLVGRVTATGKYIKSLATAVDGSQTNLAVLADDVDATSADAKGGVYLSGEFNGNALILDASWTVTTAKNAGRALSIFIKAMTAGLSATDPT